MTLCEGQGHRIDNDHYRPLVGLSAQQAWWNIARTVFKIIEHLLFDDDDDGDDDDDDDDDADDWTLVAHLKTPHCVWVLKMLSIYSKRLSHETSDAKAYTYEAMQVDPRSVDLTTSF